MEQGRRRLTAGDDERRAVRLDLGTCQLLALLEHVRDEVASLRVVLREALADRVADVGEVRVALRHERSRHEQAREAGNAEALQRDDDEGAADQAGEGVDPRVVGGRFEAAKGLAETQVADHVKSRECVPGADVEGAFGRVLVQAADQQVDVAHNDGLLLLHRLGGEGAGKELAVAGVLGVAGDVDDVVAVAFLGRGPQAFGVLPVALAMAVDVFPRRRIGEGERVGREAEDGAILLVEFADGLGKAAA